MSRSLPWLSSLCAILLFAGVAGAQFQLPEDISKEFISGPRIMLSHDLDGDGDLDQLVTGSNGALVLLENSDGQGTWVVHEVLPINSGWMNHVQVIDVDQDGLADIGIGGLGNNNSLSWIKNLGSLTFAAPIQLVNDASEPVWADLDGDGDPDMVYYGPNAWINGLNYRLNNGNGTFATAVSFSTGVTSITDLLVFDMDLDGDGDVLCRFNQNPFQLRLIQNDGEGNFTDLWTIALPFCNMSNSFPKVFVLDADNDDLEDIILSSACGNDVHTLSYRKNLGDGNFAGLAALITLPVEVLRVEVADLNGDAYTDLLTTHPQQLRMALAVGPGLFAASSVVHELLPSSSVTTSLLHLTDLNATDGQLDLLLGDIDKNRLYHYAYDGAGSMVMISRERLEGIRTNSDELHLADLDNDGNPDIVRNSEAEGWIVVYPGLGGGAFGLSRVISDEPYPEQCTLVDMNGDDLLDIVVLLNSGIQVKINQGGFQFETISDLEITGLGDELVMADFDGDGDQDIIIRDDQILLRFRYDGAGEWMLLNPQYSILNFPGASPRPVGTMDVDGDGDLDMIVQTSLQHYWVRNSGNMTFDQRFTISTLGANAREFMDVDMDGILDIVGGSNQPNSSRAWWCRVLGNGEFGPFQVLLTGAQYENNYARMGDINADGAPDVIILVPGAESGFFRLNDGTGNFGPVESLGLGDLSHRENYLPLIGDVDGDYDQDLIYYTARLNNNVAPFGLGLCRNTSNVSTGVMALSGTHDLKAMPNPFDVATQLVLPQTLNGPVVVSLLDAQGRQVRSFTATGSPILLERNGMAPGVYMALVQDQLGARWNVRLVVE